MQHGSVPVPPGWVSAKRVGERRPPAASSGDSVYSQMSYDLASRHRRSFNIAEIRRVK